MSKKSLTLPDPADLQAALDQDYPDRRWLSLLELARHTGVADTQQMQAAAGLSRDQLNRLLGRFESLAGGDILARIPFNLPLPGQRGRPPVVYKLGQAGAALLRANGYLNAHPCRLQDKTAIAHAQATHPFASLYLLRKYLDMHPRLRDALFKAAVRGGGSMKWNNITILHRMQVVIASFLRYHGLCVSKPLQAYPTVAAWGSS